jgi:hypothetical protein
MEFSFFPFVVSAAGVARLRRCGGMYALCGRVPMVLSFTLLFFLRWYRLRGFFFELWASLFAESRSEAAVDVRRLEPRCGLEPGCG